MFQAKATFQGMLLANKDKRPFVLTRAGFIGAQRCAATWTGDNLSTWEHLGMSIPMALNLVCKGLLILFILYALTQVAFMSFFLSRFIACSYLTASSLCCVQGLSGQPFSGPDIGGFVGDATPKMFARWMGIGTMLPFSRGHSEKGTIDQEPWAFGPQVCYIKPDLILML
jgi:alpha-glucosidase (family GH31 glycosyl hydrolase)